MDKMIKYFYVLKKASKSQPKVTSLTTCKLCMTVLYPESNYYRTTSSTDNPNLEVIVNILHPMNLLVKQTS